MAASAFNSEFLTGNETDSKEFNHSDYIMANINLSLFSFSTNHNCLCISNNIFKELESLKILKSHKVFARHCYESRLNVSS